MDITGYVLALLFQVIGFVVIGAAVFTLIKRRSGKQEGSLDYGIVKIELSRNTTDAERKDPMAEIAKTEQLFSTLSSSGRPFIFEVAVLHVGEDIKFYLSVPRADLDFAEREVQGLFPEAQVSRTGDYTIFGAGAVADAAYLTLKENPILPLRTYADAKIDTFAPILSTLSKFASHGEGATLQFIVRPASGGFKKTLLSAIEDLRKGESLRDVLLNTSLRGKDIAKSIYKASKKSSSDEPERAKPIDDDAVKILSAKAEKPLYSVNVRVMTGSTDPDRARDLLGAITGGFAQFSAPRRNEAVFFHPKKRERLIHDTIFRIFDPKTAVYLNAEELAGMFHLPTFTTDVPRIAWVKTKEAPPPSNLPQAGVVLGDSIFRGDSRPVRMQDDDRRRHLYFIGQTGTGKSYLAEGMAIQDIASGKGVCVIDPHGDLIDNILASIPKERIDDVIVFDPGDVLRPLGLNMLEFNPNRPEEKTFIVNEIQSIFNRLFSSESMGPMFEQYMRNALLLLMEDSVNEPATLTEVPRVFTDDAFRKRKLARIKNPAVIDFWEKEASKTTGEQGLANMAPYITSKFGNFISNDYIRPIIGQTKSSFNFREVMDNKKILLVNLSKGRIGEINARLLGMIVVGRLLLAALSRVDVTDPEKRPDFYLYIDEFQNFTTDSIAVILAEARKYRLNLILAHQFIGQLTDDIKNAVFGNVGSMVAFRVGVPDQETFIKNFGPEFSEQDLLSIENRNAFARLLIDGHPSRPFRFKTRSFPKGNTTVRDKLKELSRLTYGSPLETVESAILERLRG